MRPGGAPGLPGREVRAHARRGGDLGERGGVRGAGEGGRSFQQGETCANVRAHVPHQSPFFWGSRESDALQDSCITCNQPGEWGLFVSPLTLLICLLTPAPVQGSSLKVIRGPPSPPPTLTQVDRAHASAIHARLASTRPSLFVSGFISLSESQRDSSTFPSPLTPAVCHV